MPGLGTEDIGASGGPTEDVVRNDPPWREDESTEEKGIGGNVQWLSTSVPLGYSEERLKSESDLTMSGRKRAIPAIILCNVPETFPVNRT